jgi:Kef-type K+ transport system membrane component KefB
MDTLTSITLALLLTFIGAEIGRKFHYPRVIGQLFISLLLTIPLLNIFFSGDALIVIETLSGLGAIFLLLLTGFELNLNELKKNTKEAFIIAIFAAITPFLLGIFLGIFLDLSWQGQIVLGACLSVTAEGTTVALLLEMKKIKTRLTSIILGAGIFDDIFEIIFLSTILILSNQSNTEQNVTLFTEKMILFMGVVFLASHWIPNLIQKLQKQKTEIPILGVMIITGLAISILSEFVGLGSLLGAFVAGIILQKSFYREKNRKIESHNLRLLVFAFIVPFFFVNIGLSFDYHVFLDNPFLTGIILITAILGKLIGTFLTKPFVKLSWQQLHLIGWGMNSRGVMELVMAHIALTAGLISAEIYSAIVFMAVITTVFFPFMFKFILKKDPKIMDR